MPNDAVTPDSDPNSPIEVNVDSISDVSGSEISVAGRDMTSIEAGRDIHIHHAPAKPAENTAPVFGRETLIAQLIEHIRHNQFLAVVGASGSGKSSLVRVGVVAALQDDPNWRIHVVAPTDRPLETLALSLTRDSESITAAKTLREDLRKDPDSLHLYARRLLDNVDNARLLLVVDQFEEVFTLCRDPSERQAYIDNLLAASTKTGGPVTVLLALRADFYAHCARYDFLRQALEANQKYIGT